MVTAAHGLLAGLPWRLEIAGPATQVISKEYLGPRKARAPKYKGDMDGAGWKPYFERHYEVGNFSTKLLLRSSDLIMQPDLASVMAACARADCRRLFIKQKRGLYCGRQCAQLEHVRRWRSRQSSEQLSERRHKYYLNQLQKERPLLTKDQVRKVVQRRARPRGKSFTSQNPSSDHSRNC